MTDLYQKLCLDLKNKDENIRRTAILQLGELGNPESIPILRRAVKKDENDMVRRAAVLALKQIGDWEGIRTALQDSGFLVRETATEALGQLGDLEGVRLAFQDEYERVRIIALRELGKLRSQSGLQLILPALQDKDQQIRVAVVRELGRWGMKAELHLALQNEDEKVRSQAVQELGNLMDWEGVEQGLRDAKSEVRKEAVSSLVGLGNVLGDYDTALRYANLAIDDPSPQVREAAYDVVGELIEQEGTKTNSDSKVFTIGLYDLIPLEFGPKWRWDPSNQPRISDNELALIRPLRRKKGQRAWQASMSLMDDQYYMYPSRNQFSKVLELNFGNLGYEPVKGWLDSLPVDPEDFVVVCWDEFTSVQTTFQMFIRYWDDFCYPGDDIFVWPLSFEWVLHHFHEEFFFFGYNPAR